MNKGREYKRLCSLSSGRLTGEDYTFEVMLRRAICARVRAKQLLARGPRSRRITARIRYRLEIPVVGGHKGVRTTDIYLKGLLAEIVRPNERPIIAQVAK
jgi:hypothetical protein